MDHLLPASSTEWTSYCVSWMWSQTVNIRPTLSINFENANSAVICAESGFKETPVVQLLSNKLLYRTWLPHLLLSPFSESRGKGRCVQGQLSSDYALSASQSRAVHSRKSADTAHLVPRLFWEARCVCQAPALLVAQSTEVTQTIFKYKEGISAW